MACPSPTEPNSGEPAGDSEGGFRAGTEAEQVAIRQQLGRVLSSAAFRQSKRYSGLLTYVVERSFEGRADRLKERAIGIDVFGRPPDYDTGSDHSVRSAVGEVRKRLAQYYMEAGREAEVRIDLPAGSYAPQFRVPAVAGAPPANSDREQAPPTAASAAPRKRRRAAWGLAAGAALVALAGSALLPARLRTHNAIDRFWNPVFSSEKPALLCFGGGDEAATPEASTIADFERMPASRMNISDALTLASLTGLCQAHGKPYRILNRASATSFRDLQLGPFVLIGALNNEWTLRLTSGLRFTFEKQPSGAYIADRGNPSNKAWAVDFSMPMDQFTRDYAVVTRLHDPKTGQTAIVVAGIGSWGTQAAGEFVTDSSHLRDLVALAPANWEGKNLQAVIATNVYRGNSGPPSILAADFW